MQVALWSTLAAAGLNAVMNYLLIFGHFGLPELGLRGAAIATLGTQALICVILPLYAARAHGLAEYRLFQRLWRPACSALGQVLRLGAPIGGTQLAETGLFAASTLMMGWISTLHLAAHGGALQIASVTFMAHVGLSSAATVRAGQAWTRADAQELGRAALSALCLSGLFVLLTVAAFLGLPEVLIEVFLDRDEPQRPAIVVIGGGLKARGALFKQADAAHPAPQASLWTRWRQHWDKLHPLPLAVAQGENGLPRHRGARRLRLAKSLAGSRAQALQHHAPA